MQFPQPVTISEIALLINASVVGNENAWATGINEIHKVTPGDLVFVDHPKYYDTCIQSAATHIIINTEVECPPGKTLLIVSNPFEAYQTIVRKYRPFFVTDAIKNTTAGIAQSAIIMPQVYIGKEVVIGENAIIHNNVTIGDYTVIGDNVIIQSGTVIGSDAFYYNKKTDRPVYYNKMLSCGRVVIENDVEIGANCTIDRGVTSDTFIGAGTKIDNLVHIGHDTVIGKNCLIAAQVGIAGATTIEDNVILWGQVGVSKTLTIGANAIILAQSGVPSSLSGNTTYFGTPAIDAREKRKELVWIKRIPELWSFMKKQKQTD